jgi:hypothetical protein
VSRIVELDRRGTTGASTAPRAGDDARAPIRKDPPLGFACRGYRSADRAVLSQSGSFWFYPDAFERDGSYATEPGGFLRDIAIAPRRAVRFYLEAGRFDTSGERSILTFNRHLRDVLLAKGNTVTYSEFDGGHDYICWRHLRRRAHRARVALKSAARA